MIEFRGKSNKCINMKYFRVDVQKPDLPQNMHFLVLLGFPRIWISCFCHFHGEFKKRWGKKLQRIILLHFELVTFKFHFRKNSKIGFHRGILGSWHLGKRRAPGNPTDPFNKFFKNLEYGINIFQKSWSGNMVIWNQHLPSKNQWT